MRHHRPFSFALAMATIAALALGSPAAAHPGHDGGYTAADGARDAKQHGETAGHLPATKSNVEVVGKLRLSNVVPEKIADVSVHGNYAYLAAWGQTTCDNNGVHVVDISQPSTPKEVSFIKSKVGSYPGEGVQVVPISTSSFTGNLLVTNAEKCNDHTGYGGVNLYDVTNPARPLALFEGAGDFTAKGVQRKQANETHSVFAWDAGAKAYAVLVDNEEGTDLDILDITNPRKPVLVREYDLDETFPQIKQTAPANLVEVFLHDMVVKQINGRQVMLASYWDGGYVALDVTDPAQATYLGDSDFPSRDPELLAQTGLTENPEGNAHQAEFTRDNDYILAADEDFTSNGSRGRTDDGGSFFTVQGDKTPQLSAGQSVTGQARYVGQACAGDAAVPAATVPNQIAVVVRGVCFFAEKIANVDGKGYAAAIVVNREGSDDGCLAFAMDVDGQTPAFSVDRRTGLGFFDKESTYSETACLAGTASQLPGVNIGDTGDTVTVEAFFDGWGYVHLYKNGGGKLQELDTYAIPESMQASKATGSGDLSVHEVATSAVDNKLAYFSYYSGGLRVTRIREDGAGGARLEEVGRFIDQGGSNFWGVDVFKGADGQEYVAASDRDFGLYIVKYTGP